MLVLSRRRSEQIVIGDNVKITILEIRGDKVRVGVEAPPDVEIMRAELLPIPPGPDVPTAIEQPRQEPQLATA